MLIRSAHLPRNPADSLNHAQWLVEKKPKRGDSPASLKFFCPKHKLVRMRAGYQAAFPMTGGSPMGPQRTSNGNT